MSSITMSPSTSSLSRLGSRGRLARVGLATAAAAAIANALVYFAGKAVVGYDPAFLELGSALGIAIFTAVPAIVAALLYAALLRRGGDDPARVFAIISAVVFVVTLIPDFTFIPSEPGASNGQTSILVLMHAVAASVIVGMLTTFARPQER